MCMTASWNIAVVFVVAYLVAMWLHILLRCGCESWCDGVAYLIVMMVCSAISMGSKDGAVQMVCSAVFVRWLLAAV